MSDPALRGYYESWALRQQNGARKRKHIKGRAMKMRQDM